MLNEMVRWLFDPSGLTAHGFCLVWAPGLIWTHALSDIAIGLAYFSIPVALLAVARKRQDLVFRPMFWLFATFILLCGTTHWLSLVTLWVPIYGVEGVVKAMTAAASIVTAVALWHLMPQALTLPSPAQYREANAALHESEARYRVSFQRSPVPLHTLDGNGVLTGVSDSWLALLGYSRGDVLGRPFSDLSPPGSDAWTAADMAELRASGTLHELERRVLRQDGTAIECLVSARLEQQAGASVVVCVVVDISARHQAEAALRASEERLHHAQKMEAVGQLTGGIAHDFNNMLQGLGGGLDLMQRRIAQGRPEEAIQFAQVARGAVERAAGLTHRMLAFARRQALLPTVVDPNTLVRGMEELIRRTVGPSVQVELNLQEPIKPVLCDANQLESALLNLAINSRDAMPDGGVLTIRTASRLPDHAGLPSHDGGAPGSHAEISVTDTGTGMSPDVLERAFEPFFTTKPIGRGTGLGLSQLHGFVHQSGGVVHLESEVGQGTTVRILLPHQQEKAAGQETAAKPAGTASAAGAAASEALSRTILVVEDEGYIRSMVVDVLRDLGCAVLQAADGPAGLRVVQSGVTLDLLLTDVGLPGLNGRQLADAARELRPGLPVMLMTGYAGRALEELNLAPGMEVLGKPFTFDTLAARVRAVLDPAGAATLPGQDEAAKAPETGPAWTGGEPVALQGANQDRRLRE